MLQLTKVVGGKVVTDYGLEKLAKEYEKKGWTVKWIIPEDDPQTKEVSSCLLQSVLKIS